MYFEDCMLAHINNSAQRNGIFMNTMLILSWYFIDLYFVGFMPFLIAKIWNPFHSYPQANCLGYKLYTIVKKRVHESLYPHLKYEERMPSQFALVLIAEGHNLSLFCNINSKF